MERQRLFLGINVANSLLWTFLTAVLATGKSPVSWPVIHVNSYEAAHNAQNDDSTEDLGWPAYGTMAWLAFVYACLAAFSFWKDPRMINVATNACLLCLFSGLVIALVAPAYAGHWKGKFRKRIVQNSIWFSGFLYKKTSGTIEHDCTSVDCFFRYRKST